MNKLAKSVCGFSALTGDVILVTALSPLFRLFGEIASGGGEVTPEQDAAGNTLLLAVAIGAGLIVLALSLCLVNAIGNPRLQGRRQREIVLLVAFPPVTVPVYFGLKMLGDCPDVDAAPDPRRSLHPLARCTGVLLGVSALLQWTALPPEAPLWVWMGVEVIATTATAAVFLLWFHRASSNLRAAGLPDIVNPPGWAVAGFFVPILNLFRPVEVMCETWRGSAAMRNGTRADWRRGSLSPAIAVWWAGWLLPLLLRRIRAPGIEMVTAGCVTMSAAALLYLVWRITVFQEDAAVEAGRRDNPGFVIG